MSFDEIAALERDQLAVEKQRPLPRAKVTRGVTLMLLALRIYVLIAVPVVIYAFAHALLAGS
jgi:4-hydroxybenzoate polyprenyltransferase